MCRLDRRHTGADTARKAVAMGLDPGDISTIEDEGSIDGTRHGGDAGRHHGLIRRSGGQRA
jgi:hypothetical protein